MIVKTPPATPVFELTLEALKSQVQGDLLFPRDAGYDQARSGWNLSIQQKPAIILLAEDPSDIALAVRYADQAGLGITVQATGHGTLQPGDGCLLIVTARMNQVEIDPKTGIAWLEAGTQWSEVLDKAQEHGLAPLLGSSPNVGAVGYTLGGGLGWLALFLFHNPMDQIH